MSSAGYTTDTSYLYLGSFFSVKTFLLTILFGALLFSVTWFRVNLPSLSLFEKSDFPIVIPLLLLSTYFTRNFLSSVVVVGAAVLGTQEVTMGQSGTLPVADSAALFLFYGGFVFLSGLIIGAKSEKMQIILLLSIAIIELLIISFLVSNPFHEVVSESWKSEGVGHPNYLSESGFLGFYISFELVVAFLAIFILCVTVFITKDYFSSSINSDNVIIYYVISLILFLLTAVIGVILVLIYSGTSSIPYTSIPASERIFIQQQFGNGFLTYFENPVNAFLLFIIFCFMSTISSLLYTKTVNVAKYTRSLRSPTYGLSGIIFPLLLPTLMIMLFYNEDVRGLEGGEYTALRPESWYLYFGEYLTSVMVFSTIVFIIVAGFDFYRIWRYAR